MNPRDRLLTTIRGGEADRVPLVLPGFEFPSRAALEAHPDPLRRDIARRVFDTVAFRVQVPSYVNRYLVTPPQRITTETRPLPNGHSETRGVIDTPKGELTFITRHDPISNTTWQVKYPVESMEEIEKIASVPWELPDALDGVDQIDKSPDIPPDFERRGILETRISSPFVCVSGMMRYEWFLELTLTEHDLIAELTEICRQRILDVLHTLLTEPGIEYVWIGGSEWVTPPMASPATYDALVQEQERSLIAYIHGQGDIVVHVHCHGNVRHALPRTIERGGDYTEPVEPPPDGDITMVEAKAVADGRITLGGNIECRVLANESEVAVEAAVHAAFEGGKRRFVLRPTEGPSPRLGEREFRNYMRMLDVWEALSPLSPSPKFGEGAGG
jgi:hypothetical protein